MQWSWLAVVLICFSCSFSQISLTLGNKADIDDFYQLALRSKSLPHNNSVAVIGGPLSRIQLIRIPKASSTSLSVVARRLMGCSPPGPCCKYPGDPPGSCPHRELFTCQQQFKVIGCTGHNVDYHVLLDGKVPTISIIREPRSRSLSAYFYPGHHHNSECMEGLLPCFEMYLDDSRFRNIAVKMFTGEYAYAPARTCQHTVDCRHSLEAAKQNVERHVVFLGIAELWELSLVVLHKRFPNFAPDISEFSLAEGTSDSEKLAQPITLTNNSIPMNVRINRDSTYLDFKNMALTQYLTKLNAQSALDSALYQFALERFCAELHTLHLWKLKRVQSYWRNHLPAHHTVDKCK